MPPRSLLPSVRRPREVMPPPPRIRRFLLPGSYVRDLPSPRAARAGSIHSERNRSVSRPQKSRAFGARGNRVRNLVFVLGVLIVCALSSNGMASQTAAPLGRVESWDYAPAMRQVAARFQGGEGVVLHP